MKLLIHRGGEGIPIDFCDNHFRLSTTLEALLNDPAAESAVLYINDRQPNATAIREDRSAAVPRFRFAEPEEETSADEILKTLKEAYTLMSRRVHEAGNDYDRGLCAIGLAAVCRVLLNHR